jgi:outer membrane protein
MKKLMFLSLLLAAAPLVAQDHTHTDLFFDIEGVHRTGSETGFSPGVIRFEPTFNTGGGLGGGANFFFTDHVSLEAKVAALEGRMHVRIVGQDSVQIINIGLTQMYPLSATLQWHTTGGAFRPYFGAGVVHTILHNVNKQVPNTTISAIHFRDPTGLLIDGGLDLSLGRKWYLFGDARYVPVETRSRATFVGTTSFTELRVRPLIVSTGIGYRYR